MATGSPLYKDHILGGLQERVGGVERGGVGVVENKRRKTFCSLSIRGGKLEHLVARARQNEELLDSHPRVLVKRHPRPPARLARLPPRQLAVVHELQPRTDVVHKLQVLRSFAAHPRLGSGAPGLTGDVEGRLESEAGAAVGREHEPADEGWCDTDLGDLAGVEGADFTGLDRSL